LELGGKGEKRCRHWLAFKIVVEKALYVQAKVLESTETTSVFA
jgi:hypothetical protein